MTSKDYNETVRTYSGRLYRFVLKSLQNVEDANDIVQETFMKLWQHKEKVELEKAKSWLFTTAYRALVNLAKKNKRESSLDSIDFNEPFTNGHNYELKEVLDKCLDLLPPQQKTILLLRDLEGYNYKEIGEMLELSESQVKVYLFRARQKIKNQIKDLNILA